MKVAAGLVWCLMLGTLSSAGPSAAQSLTSTTSLVTIPVAGVQPDGTVFLGGGFANRKYTDFVRGKYHYTPYFVSVAYFPFMEVSLRFTRPVGEPDIGQDLGDRMMSVRLRLLEEKKGRPALLVGFHDLFSATSRRFHALYLVASKHVVPHAITGPVGIHIGYGSDMIPARRHQFAGFFGGVSASPLSVLDLLLEYDGAIPTGGVRVTVLNHVQLLAALQNFDTFAGGATVMIRM